MPAPAVDPILRLGVNRRSTLFHAETQSRDTGRRLARERGYVAATCTIRTLASLHSESRYWHQRSGPRETGPQPFGRDQQAKAMLTCRDSKTEQRPDRPCPIRLDGAGGALCQVRRTQGYKGRDMTGRRLHLKRHEYQSDNLSIVRTDGRCSGGGWCYYGNSWSGGAEFGARLAMQPNLAGCDDLYSLERSAGIRTTFNDHHLVVPTQKSATFRRRPLVIARLCRELSAIQRCRESLDRIHLRA
ncbi:hypothetical protein ABIB75_005311 [Bradyrhizobium sp. GM2.2]